MPVRSLSSSVFRWPDAREVDRAVRRWAGEVVRRRPDILRIGYIGSYARGDWGVGSDLDLIIILKQCGRPFWKRAAEWDVTSLPVPADVLVYTEEEWEAMAGEGRRFHRTAEEEAVWIYRRIDWR